MGYREVSPQLRPLFSLSLNQRLHIPLSWACKVNQSLGVYPGLHQFQPTPGRAVGVGGGGWDLVALGCPLDLRFFVLGAHQCDLGVGETLVSGSRRVGDGRSRTGGCHVGQAHRDRLGPAPKKATRLGRRAWP